MIHQRAYLCGHFTSTNVTDLTKRMVEFGWTKSKETVPDTEKEIYYNNFQEFMFSKSMSHGCYTFNRELNDSFTVGTTSIKLIKLQLYILPLNVILFSINIELTSDSVKSICSIMRKLRNCRNYGSLHKKWKGMVVAPLKEVCQFLTDNKNASYIDLVENSDRLRIMRIVWSDEESLNLVAQDRHKLLYNLCTDDWRTDDKGISTDESDTYIENIIARHSLQIFKTWEVLSLSNSFTVLYINPYNDSKQINLGNSQIYDYWGAKFRILYIYALFQKCYLFKLNNSHFEMIKDLHNSNVSKPISEFFSLIKSDSSALTNLTKEYTFFENRYVFRNISYNTFTSTLYNSMYNGLEIDKERIEIARVMKSEKEEEDATNNKKLNHILLLLSLFTMFSAILAAGDLVNKIIPYKYWLPNHHMGFLLITLLILIAFQCFIRHLNRNR